MIEVDEDRQTNKQTKTTHQLSQVICNPNSKSLKTVTLSASMTNLYQNYDHISSHYINVNKMKDGP